MCQLPQSSVQDTSPLSEKQRAEIAEARVKELNARIKELEHDKPTLVELYRRDHPEAFDSAKVQELAEDLDAVRNRCHYAEKRVKELETAIRTHWEQKADDRCWEDDSKLYSVVPLPDTTARCIGDPEVMLENCKRFIKQRTCAGGPWKSYAELEAENAKLREQIRHATEALEVCYAPANPGSGAPLSVLATWAGNEIAELREQLANSVQVVRGPTTLPDGHWAVYCPVETRLGGQLIIDSLIAFRLPDREEE